MMYAVGQGALAVECRSDNEEILKMLAPFNHPETYCRVLAERSFLKTLGKIYLHYYKNNNHTK